MCDGSVDSAVEERELVYVRSCQAEKVHINFVGIQSVEKRDAEHITNAISSMMASVSSREQPGQWRDKLVACATDGAAVMVGVKTGVMSRLCEDRPFVMGIHCMAHRLELAYKDTVKGSTHRFTESIDRLEIL